MAIRLAELRRAGIAHDLLNVPDPGKSRIVYSFGGSQWTNCPSILRKEPRTLKMP
jgi:hypothetical protein